MFLEQATDELRQGDVCFSWPVPRWVITDHQILSDPDGKRTKMQVSIQGKGADLPIVLCSHDCELENPRTRLGFLVAPLLPWPYQDMSSDESLELISSARRDSNEFAYIHLFPLAIPSIDADEDTSLDADTEASPDGSVSWRVADFSGMISVAPPVKASAILRKGKRLEMTEDERMLFKTKLAAFLGR